MINLSRHEPLYPLLFFHYFMENAAVALMLRSGETS